MWIAHIKIDQEFICTILAFCWVTATIITAIIFLKLDKVSWYTHTMERAWLQLNNFKIRKVVYHCDLNIFDLIRLTYNEGCKYKYILSVVKIRFFTASRSILCWFLYSINSGKEMIHYLLQMHNIPKFSLYMDFYCMKQHIYLINGNHI